MKILGGNKVAIGMIVVSAGISSFNALRISKENSEIKNEIKAKDPERYDRLREYNDASWKNIVKWEEERQKMNDSLKIDSIAKKAYFEGAQIVRDSINSANTSN